MFGGSYFFWQEIEAYSTFSLFTPDSKLKTEATVFSSDCRFWSSQLFVDTADGARMALAEANHREEPETVDWRQLEFPATTNRNPRFFRADPDHEDMVKDQQVRRLVKLRKNEKTLTMAAARAGLSRKTARKYLKSGTLPSQCQPERYWSPNETRSHRSRCSNSSRKRPSTSVRPRIVPPISRSLPPSSRQARKRPNTPWQSFASCSRCRS